MAPYEIREGFQAGESGMQRSSRDFLQTWIMFNVVMSVANVALVIALNCLLRH